MGQPNIPVDVKLFIAVTFNDKKIYEQINSILTQAFGFIDTFSEVYDFVYTQYYSREMGVDLKKQFWGFQKLIRPEELVDIKLKTNDIETQFSRDGKRQVNLDPGYLTGAKVILATTKNFDHRIYLGKGIFGDVHLRYREERFIFNDWTYPDYRDPIAIAFFSQLRSFYMKEYREIIKQPHEGV